MTVAQDAIPRRRPATLSDDAFVAVGPEPARGGPADRREIDVPLAPAGADRRTHVQSGAPSPAAGPQPGGPVPGSVGSPGVAVPIVTDPGPVFRIQGLDPSRPSGPRAALVGFTVTPGEDPALAALRASIVAAAAEADPASAPVRRRTAVAVLEPEPPSTAAPPAAPSRPSGRARRRRPRPSDAPRSAGSPTSDASWRPVPGLVPRRQPRRCASPSAHTTVTSRRPKRRPHVPTRAPSGPPRRRPSARSGPRAASASNADAVEGAARDWLHEINRINAEAREAVAIATRERGGGGGGRCDARAPEPRGRRCPDRRRHRRGRLRRCTDRPGRVRRAPGRSIRTPSSCRRCRRCRRPTVPTPTRCSEIAIEAGATPRIFRLLHGDRTRHDHAGRRPGGERSRSRRRIGTT